MYILELEIIQYTLNKWVDNPSKATFKPVLNVVIVLNFLKLKLKLDKKKNQKDTLFHRGLR